MLESTTQFLTDQLHAYAESWQRDHADALACWELEARMKVALTLFEVIRDLDERLAQDVTARRASFDRALSEEMRKLYAAWERPTARIVPLLKDLWAKGFKVEGAEAFADAVLDARSMLSISPEELDESARQLRAGERRSMAEVVDGVRRRLGA